jgi:hypothetical protein
MVGVSTGRPNAVMGWNGHLLAVRRRLRLAALNAISPIPELFIAIQFRSPESSSGLFAAVSDRFTRARHTADLDWTDGQNRSGLASASSGSA